MGNFERLLWAMAALALLWPGAARAQLVEESYDTRVVLLGSGTPNPTPDRMGPALAVTVGDGAYLVDAGTGLVRRAEEARRLGLAALAPKNLKTAFLTHLHSDHALGLADLILTPWIDGRSEPLKLYGPPGTKAMAMHLLDAYIQDINIRIKGSQPQNATGWRVNASETSGGFVFKDRRVSVEAFRVCHGEMRDSFGYRFTTPSRVIVVSGDTTYCPVVAEMARGADVLVHEVYSNAGFKHLPDDWKAYHKAHHTSARDVARIARAAQPKLLVLYHQLSWGSAAIEGILDEVKADYDGEVVYGRDLGIY